VLSPDHPDVLAGIRDLSNSYAALGRHADALRLREEVLAARRRVLSPDHPETLWSAHDLADSYMALGRHADALPLNEKTLAARKRVLGPDHPDALWSLLNVAACLLALDRGPEALPVMDECLRRAAGKDVPPPIIPSVMDLRLRHFQKAGDPAGCRATAEMWEALNRTDGESLYVAARMRAVASAVQAKVSGADTEQLAREDADRALVWLAKAIAAGFRDRKRLETEGDLAALRDRSDFRKMLDALPEESEAK
jgi:tetratricopeptide (TPR) repeat protein